MALYGGARDISMFRHVSRELLGDIITQQVGYYILKLEYMEKIELNLLKKLLSSIFKVN